MVSFESARKEILEWVASTLSIKPEAVALDKPLPELGIDSLDAVHLLATIESAIQTELPEDVVKRVRCLNDIFEMMAQRLAAA